MKLFIITALLVNL